MNVKDAIVARRSIRKFTTTPVPPNLMNELLSAAAMAPSGCNAQPWRFRPVENKQVKKRLRSKGAFLQDWVYDAPTILVCCGDPEAYGTLESVSYQFRDGTLAQPEKELLAFLSGKEDT